jgi:hypothetical protein
MMSGADLIRTTGQNTDRAKRLKVVDAVKPVENPGQINASLDENTQNALLRFARFVNKEKKKPVPAVKKPSKGLLQPYLDQVQKLNQEQSSGSMIDVYI